MARKRRTREYVPNATSEVFETGKQMYDRMFFDIHGEGVSGGHAVTYGANRWQMNFNGVVSDPWGPMPDVNEFTYPKNRWRKYLFDYMGPEGINGLRRAMRMGMAGQGDAFWPTTVRVHHQGMRAHNEKGNCFVGVSFRSNPHPQVTMISRTNTLTPMGLLDISFGVLLTRMFARVCNQAMLPTFAWQIPSICVTPSHSTILWLKKGAYKYELDRSEITKKTKKHFEKQGEHWPGHHKLIFPEDFDSRPTQEKYAVRMLDQFMQEDDREDGDGYAQYKRMQRKIRLYLWDAERIKPWVPVLPDQWFEDMFGKNKAWAKDHENQPLKEIVITKDDIPRGRDLSEYPTGTTYDEASSDVFRYPEVE